MCQSQHILLRQKTKDWPAVTAIMKYIAVFAISFNKLARRCQLVVGFSGIFRTGYPTGIETGTRVPG